MLKEKRQKVQGKFYASPSGQEKNGINELNFVYKKMKDENLFLRILSIVEHCTNT